MEYKECKDILNEWIDEVIEKSKNHIKEGRHNINKIDIDLPGKANFSILIFSHRGELSACIHWKKCGFYREYFLQQLKPKPISDPLPLTWDSTLLEILPPPDDAAKMLRQRYEEKMANIIHGIKKVLEAHNYDPKIIIANGTDNILDKYVKTRDKIIDEFNTLIKNIASILPERLKQSEKFYVSIPLQSAVPITSLQILWPELEEKYKMWFTFTKCLGTFEIYIPIMTLMALSAKYFVDDMSLWRYETAFPELCLQFLTIINIHKDRIINEIKKEIQKAQEV